MKERPVSVGDRALPLPCPVSRRLSGRGSLSGKKSARSHPDDYRWGKTPCNLPRAC